MSDIDETTLDSNQTQLETVDGISVLHGSMKIDGNLDVQQQLSTQAFKVWDDKHLILTTVGDTISFTKSCQFTKPVEFNNGQTLIGIETTYHSAFVGSTTILAGDRLVVGDSLFKITSDSRSIIADTFKMSLNRLDVDNIYSKKETTDLVTTKNLNVTNELIGKTIYADVIKGKTFAIENIRGLNLTTVGSLTTKDLIVNGAAKIITDLTISGSGVTAAALTVNGGSIIANKGIVSHTANNRFSTMEIMGSGTSGDVCFKVDAGVDSLFEGDVTIQDSNLILDNTKLVTNDIVVSPLTIDSSDTTGVHITTKTNWETYKSQMVTEVETREAMAETYDPYATVASAIDRNAYNYTKIEKTIKSIINPINYAMEQGLDTGRNVPQMFTVNTGIHRIDSNGHALLKEVVSEKGRFSSLSAYDFKVNQVEVDKLVTTSVASNVVHTDNLLKSEGIAEFDGVINTNADIFIEKDSNVNVDEGSTVTFQEGSSLVINNGAKFELNNNTSVKMSGDIELSLKNLVFVDPQTRNKYRIGFREATCCEGGGVVMEYHKVEEEETSATDIVYETARSAIDLDSKLKSLGL